MTNGLGGGGDCSSGPAHRCLGTGAVEQQDDGQREGRGCSAATLRGAYGLQIQGTRTAPAPAPPGTIESVIGVNIRHYDGNGNFTQIGNDKGSVSGSGPVDRRASAPIR
jgi:hypothetical protein